MTELSTTLAAEINQAHADCMECDEDLGEIILRKCNKARECGLYLKEFCGQYQRAPFFDAEGERIPLKCLWMSEGKSTFTFAFTYQTARNYMRYADANPQPITSLAVGVRSLWDAMIACGAIAAPLGHGEQQRSALTWLDRTCIQLSKVREMFHGQIEKSGPLDTWSEPQRQALKRQIEPVVKIYELL